MFVQALETAGARLRAVNADMPDVAYVAASAPRARRARLVGRWVCAPGARKPNCLWEVEKTGGDSGRQPEWLCAA